MTSKREWTAGPWSAICDGNRVIGANYETVAAILAPTNMLATVEDPAEARANAHLIAAAPALYEALALMVEIYGPPPYAPVVKQARAALARAEGRES